MKKVITLVGVLVCFFVFVVVCPGYAIHAGAMNWAYLCTSDDGSVFYYDMGNIKTSDGIVRTWIKDILSEESRNELIVESDYAEWVPRAHHAVHYAEINCRENKVRALEMTFYDVNGKYLYVCSDDDLHTWEPLSPSSVADSWREKLCPAAKK